MKDINELTEACLDRMLVSRTSLVRSVPFFTILASKLKPVANITWCKTLAVDGKHLFFNPIYVMGYRECLTAEELVETIASLEEAFPDATQEQLDAMLDGLSDKNLTFAICHEILHCAYDHFMRKGMRDHSMFNRAADYAINQILIRSNIGEIHPTWLYDRQFDFMAAEEIYEILKHEKQDEKEGGEGEGEGGGSGDGQDGKKSKRAKSHRGTTLDHHQTPEGTPEEREERMRNFRSSVISAAQASGTPSEIAEFVTSLVKPKIDWRSKLHRTLRSHLKSDLTYMNPSRRSWGYGGSYIGNPIFPGYKPDETIDIAVALDASGSISEEMLRDFLSEVVGMTKQFQQFKIRLMTFDTSVYTVREYKTGEERKILEYPIHGGGGTDFMAVYEHMKADNYKPKQLVMFTDGMPYAAWGDPDYCKALFVVHTYDVVSPFGETVHYTYDGDE